MIRPWIGGIIQPGEAVNEEYVREDAGERKTCGAPPQTSGRSEPQQKSIVTRFAIVAAEPNSRSLAEKRVGMTALFVVSK
jgi:hypothetical protein